MNKILYFVLILGVLACEKDQKETPCDQEWCFFSSLVDFEPAWSPDGSTIAYVHGDTLLETTGLYLINADGTNPRILFSGVSAYSPTWSPDSKWIAFSNGGHIFKIKINGDSLTQLTTEGRNFFPDWSPNGERIAYARSVCDGPQTCGIWTINASGISNTFIVDYGYYPTWTYLSDQIAFLTRVIVKTGPNDTDVKELGDSLWLIDPQTRMRTGLALLQNQNLYNSHISFASTSNKIVFQSQPDGDYPNIWIMNSDGTGRKQLTSIQAFTPAWSPDGKKIVYTNSDPENGHLWVMDADGRNKYQLTN